jgi:hypothetical protein
MPRMTAKQKQNLGHLVEQKILEFFGDPDNGLAVKRGFLNSLQKRLRGEQKLTPNSAVLKKYGVN